ncbi:MAG: hypothetical protein ACTHKU_08685 [Verrucomicrobiota bacterium]
MFKMPRWFYGSIALLLASFGPQHFCSAQPINAWIYSASGHWEYDTDWSLGTLPASGQSVMITNGGFKSVGIFPSSSANFPNSMTIGSLSVFAPTNGLNTLLLNYSGTAVPLHVSNGILIGTNGILMNLYSGLRVDGNNGGQLAIQAGTLVQEGGLLTVATNALCSVAVGGAMNLTNAVATFGTLIVDNDGTPTFNNTNFSVVTQSGGEVRCDLLLKAGNYYLFAGSFSGTCTSISGYSGRFMQYGGTNFAEITLGYSSYLNQENYGIYTLYNGVLMSPRMSLGTVSYSGGEFDQVGGSVSIGSLNLGGGSFGSYSGSGFYNLTNGSLLTDTIEFYSGYIHQVGGQHTASKGLSLIGYFEDYGPGSRSVSYDLSGGNLACPSIDMGLLGYFTQSGGTNRVTQDLTFLNTRYTLSDGALFTSNTIVLFGRFVTSDRVRAVSQFLQSGGEHHVSNTLSNMDQYILSGGSLSANRIVLQGTLTVSNAAVLNSGLFDFSGGSLRIYGAATENLGQALLSASSLMDLQTGSHWLTFSNSSAIPWSSSTLSVMNWQGSTNGGGSDRLIFGTSASGLTAAQLSRIQFVNPGGFPVGRYPARMLGTGEVVPAPLPTLLFSWSQNNLILMWTGMFVLQSSTNVLGPYTNVVGATSPYNSGAAVFPTQFFRLSLNQP